MQNQNTLFNGDEMRSVSEVLAEPDLCPFASRVFFPISKRHPDNDLVRICEVREDGHGATCAVFRLKPFNECPAYVDYLAHLGDAKK